MQRLAVQPGDVFVVHTEQILTPRQRDALRAEMERVLPGAKVLVLEGRVRLGVVQLPPAAGERA
jgi:hypothetical protein